MGNDNKKTRSLAVDSASAGSARYWPPLDEIDGETEHLLFTVEAGWEWQFPGWQWVADTINRYSGGNRTAAACRSKYAKIATPSC